MNPPLTALALTLVTRTAGSLNAFTVTAPPNGTSGVTTSAPPETRTKKSTESGGAEHVGGPAEDQLAA